MSEQTACLTFSDQVLHLEPWPGLRHQAHDGQGVSPGGEFLYHHIPRPEFSSKSLQVMTTVVEDCQFVCITQADYYKILHEGEDALVREEDEQGELVKVSEVRRTDDGQKHAKVIGLSFE